MMTPRPGSSTPDAGPRSTDGSHAVIDHSSVVERRTRLAISLGSVALRTLAVGGMLLIAYLAVTQGWIPAATESVVGWYSANIAPYLAIDPVVMQLPEDHGTLFGNATTPSFVVTD
ncbi:hypothetical protein [Demequina sp. SO4-18]|uniref:hypothetical protein n=1 Tax=Demequina sp. SO4-18 TaxID=3401026 RepID=UPI003B5B4C20